jgi:hypothetical protein
MVRDTTTGISHRQLPTEHFTGHASSPRPIVTYRNPQLRQRGQGAQNIDSAMAPQSVRAQAWQRLARDLDISKLASITHEIALGEAIAVAASLSTSIDNY